MQATISINQAVAFDAVFVNAPGYFINLFFMDAIPGCHKSTLIAILCKETAVMQYENDFAMLKDFDIIIKYIWWSFFGTNANIDLVDASL